MDIGLLKYILPLVTFITAATGQDLSVSLSIHPSADGGKVVINSTVVLRCTVHVNIVGHGTAEWYRRQGANRYQLATNGFAHHNLDAARYHLQTESRTSSSSVYLLTIYGVQVEDSGVFECTAGTVSSRKASQVLAVCADLTSSVCDCTLSYGWTSPDCIYAAESDDGFERATVGLSVCLVVTLVYASLATAVVAVDCRRKLQTARLKEADRQASLARSAAAVSSRTASVSAMKPGQRGTDRQTAATLNDRPSAAAAVRFTDEPSTDISC